MAQQNLTDFNLPKNSYATFDALTLKQLIKNRLNEGGVFTDQNFEGSNLSAIIDIVALSYHYLLFYQNNTAADSLFDSATLYENMNRIVKTINYKPTGFKTSLLSFQATANANLAANIYTIKRYSFFTINGIYYSFTKDATFSKTVFGTETLDSLANEALLYQGKVVEYPPQLATGEDYETFTIAIKNNITNTPINIDQDSINIYVLDVNTGTYTEFTITDSIFLESSSSNKCELRFNENGFYEVKFGNGVFGKKLNVNDQVLIYYVQSDGEAGMISANQLNGSSLNFYTTPQFQLVAADVLNPSLNYLAIGDATNIAFSNTIASSPPRLNEGVDDIRVNAPKTYFSQNRLVTQADFETYIDKNYSNIVVDSAVVNNNTFISEFIKYFYTIGLLRPNQDPRVLFNEVNFSHAGQENSVHIFCVPRIKNVDTNNTQFFLQNSQKNTILTGMNDQKTISTDLIPQEPIYTAFALACTQPNEAPSIDTIADTYLVIKKRTDVRVNADQIKNDVNAVFQTYFDADNCKLGQLVSITDLAVKLFAINGVGNFYMQRTLANGDVITNSNLTLLVFNPNYSDIDIQATPSNTQLPFFKFPFLWNKTILNNIIVE